MGRARPLQQVLQRDRLAHEDANDRIGDHGGLVGEEGDRQRAPREVLEAHSSPHEPGKGWRDQDGERAERPEPRRPRQPHPAEDQEQEEQRARQAPAKVVGDLPAVDA